MSCTMCPHEVAQPMMDFLYPALDWREWRDDWPLARHSQFVQSGGLHWHVQTWGRGPVMLLLHGTGSSTHTWRDLMPAWAAEYTVVGVDLPGHAFTGIANESLMGLQGMAQAVQQLMLTLRLEPQVIVGHSAGAAVAAQMVLQSEPAGKPLLVALNPAWLPMPGMAGWLFAPAAKLVALNPMSAWMMAKQAARGTMVERVLKGTGSSLTPQGVALYKRLLSQPVHVRGVLSMMVGWELSPWSTQLERLDSPVLILCGESDHTIAPNSTQGLAQRLPQAQHVLLPKLGHLAHEEAPIDIVRRVSDWVATAREGKGRSDRSRPDSSSPPH